MSAKPKAPKPQHVPVGELSVGQKITARVKYLDNGDLDPVLLKRPVEVKSIEPCPGQRRTHVHINKVDCWDGRTLVGVR